MVVMLEEIKVALLEKRSINKSFFFTRNNYKTRLFVLDTLTLRYFSGTAEARGNQKYRIDLVSILSVEPVVDRFLDGKHNVFQIVFMEKNSVNILYVVCPSANSRDTWMSAIRSEAVKSKAQFQDRYHKGVWMLRKGYNCCKSKDKRSTGCVESTYIPMHHGRDSPTSMSLASVTSGNVRLSTLLIDNMLKRSVGKSAFFPVANYKTRTFVLDANSIRYYHGDARVRDNEKGRIHLSCVVTVEPVEIDDEYKYNHMFQISYFDEYELYRLYIVAMDIEIRDKWIRTVKKEAIKNGAEFLPNYHASNWVKHKGHWACCNSDNKRSEGCRRVIVQQDMKLCGSDLNVSHTASTRAKSPPEIKVAVMLKRSQNKGTFITSNNYQQRVFTLDQQCLAFYTGYLEDRGELKGYIPFIDMVSVEPVRDGMLDDKVNVFQVLYYEYKNLYNLYVVANSDQERSSWVASIKKEAIKANVVLHPRYHPGVWLKSTRSYNCCGRTERDSLGCADAGGGMSLVSVRDRLNTLDSAKGIRHRLGTLDSVPEEITARSIKNTLDPKSAELNIQRTKPEDNTTHATDRPTISRENNTMEKKKEPQKEETIHEMDSHQEPSLRKGEWSRGITNIATSTSGIRPVGSGYQMNRSRSGVYSNENSRGSSRQPSFITSSQYSEDFESVSEIEV